MDRLFFTGDLHGSPNRLSTGSLAKRVAPGQADPGPGDVVLVAGDAGLLFGSTPEGETREEAYWLDWLAAKPWTLAFVDGNHENFPLLDALHREERFGGTVGVLRPNVLHLRRGQVLDILGRRVFVLGGASSWDRPDRTEGRDWWPEEVPSVSELDAARRALDAADWSVDCVLTHAAPAFLVPAVGPAKATVSGQPLEAFLDEVAGRLSFRDWYFGHYHEDCRLGKGYRFRAIYRDIEEYCLANGRAKS